MVCELFVIIHTEDKWLEPEWKSALSLSTHFFPKESFSKEVSVRLHRGFTNLVSHITADGHLE